MGASARPQAWHRCSSRRSRSAAHVPGLAPRTRQLLGDYLELTKPKVQSLLLLTTIADDVRRRRPLARAGRADLPGRLSVGGRRRRRQPLVRPRHRRAHGAHRDRPIPAGRVSPRAALAFGCALAGLSLLELSLTVNVLAAGLSFAGFLGYVFVYTVWLKRRTPQNIVIGGAAGAVPPLVGWAAVTGSVSGTAVILFFIVFFWTPPHFWALSLLMKDEYAKVGVPMLPVVRGEAETRRQILLYSVLLYAVTPAAVLRRRLRRDLPARLARARPRLHRGRAAPVPPRGPALGAAGCTFLAGLPGAAVLRDGRRRPPVDPLARRYSLRPR